VILPGTGRGMIGKDKKTLKKIKKHKTGFQVSGPLIIKV
jgi:hypothetical protein